MNPEEELNGIYQFEDGSEYSYNIERKNLFLEEYTRTFGRTLPREEVVKKWVVANGYLKVKKPQIKKGDFVVAFGPTGTFSFSGFAHHTVFNVSAECWQTEDGYTFNPDHKRLFICKSGLLVNPKLEGEALSVKHFGPRTIEEAERFCTEVTG